MRRFRSDPRTRRVRLACCLPSAVLFASGGCSWDATDPRNTPIEQVAFVIESGNAQTGEVGTALPQALVIQAKTAGDIPIAGLVINFVPAAGDGKVYGGASSTDAEGNARDYWTLGTTAGPQNLEVRAVDPTSGEKLLLGTFSATGVAGPATQLLPRTGDNQAGPIGSWLGAPTRILVADQFANPVSGVTVSFAIISGGGSLETPASATTAAAGLAKSGRWNLGATAGINTLRATAPGLVSFTFHARGLARLALGREFGCGLTSGGAAHCWGSNTLGALGDGTGSSRFQPGLVSGGIAFKSLAAGSDHVCGLNSAGIAYCWGFNLQGELGDGSDDNRNVPTAVIGGLTFTALTAGGGHTCGLTASGAAYCWGYNTSGQLGDGSKANRLAPKAVTGGIQFTALAAGGASTCGLDITGSPFCWGRNNDGQLSDGTNVDHARPVRVKGGLRLTSLVAGGSHFCGLTDEGIAWCWGLNNSGQLGVATFLDPTPPVAVGGGLLFTSLTAGGYHTCGITTTGQNKCWGWNGAGQLGDGGTSEYQVTLSSVAGGVSFAALSGSLRSTCGLTADAVAYCWGYNTEGQLGDGTTVDRLVPAPVLGGVRFLGAPASDGLSLRAR